MYVTALNLCPNAGETVCGVSTSKSGSKKGGVFRSIDGGSNWEELTEGMRGLDQANSNYFDIAFDPKDQKTIYLAQTTLEGVADGTLFRSRDEGTSWEDMVDRTKIASGWHSMDKYGPDF